MRDSASLGSLSKGAYLKYYGQLDLPKTLVGAFPVVHMENYGTDFKSIICVFRCVNMTTWR